MDTLGDNNVSSVKRVLNTTAVSRICGASIFPGRSRAEAGSLDRKPGETYLASRYSTRSTRKGATGNVCAKDDGTQPTRAKCAAIAVTTGRKSYPYPSLRNDNFLPNPDPAHNLRTHVKGERPYSTFATSFEGWRNFQTFRQRIVAR